MKKISVIVPIYNSEKYLNKCLDSIINQTYGNLEIILINDGSKDNSKKICEDYAKNDSRIIIIDQENCGPAKTRNCGLKIASGEYISFVDSDDYIDKTMYEKLVKRIIKDQSDIAICKHVEVINEKIKHMKYNYELPVIYSDNIIKLFLKGNTVNAYLWNKIYKRELFKKTEFINIKMLEDLDIMYRLLKKCKKISFINNELYYYRCDNVNSLSKTYSKQMIDGYCYALNRMYKDLCLNFLVNNEVNFNKVIMYIPLFTSIAHSPYLKSDSTFENIYLDFKKAFKYVISHKEFKELNAKQMVKGLILYYNKNILYRIFRRKI